MKVNKDTLAGMLLGAGGILYLQYKMNRNKKQPQMEKKEEPDLTKEFMDAVNAAFNKEETPADTEEQEKEIVKQLAESAKSCIFDDSKIETCREMAKMVENSSDSVKAFAANEIVSLAKDVVFDSTKKELMKIAREIMNPSQK